jgi:hypothetical protein
MVLSRAPNPDLRLRRMFAPKWLRETPTLRDAVGFLVLFLGGGLALFALAVILEWRWQDDS